MKYTFKFFILILLLSIIFLSVYSCNKEMQIKNISDSNPTTGNVVELIPTPGESCLNSALPCQPITELFSFQGITGYPSCDFRIELTYCVSYPFPGVVEIVMGDYKILPFGDNCCNTYLDSLAYFSATPSEADDVAWIARLDNAIIDKLENFLYVKYSSNLVCGTAHGQFSIAYVKQACNTLCYVFIPPDEKEGGLGGEGLNETKTENRGTDQPPVPNTFVRANCNTQGCCRRDTKMCYNPITNIVEKTTINLVYPSNVTPENACAGGSIQYPTLPHNSIIIKCLNCSFSCPN